MYVAQSLAVFTCLLCVSTATFIGAGISPLGLNVGLVRRGLPFVKNPLLTSARLQSRFIRRPIIRSPMVGMSTGRTQVVSFVQNPVSGMPVPTSRVVTAVQPALQTPQIVTAVQPGLQTRILSTQPFLGSGNEFGNVIVQVPGTSGAVIGDGTVTGAGAVIGDGSVYSDYMNGGETVGTTATGQVVVLNRDRPDLDVLGSVIRPLNPVNGRELGAGGPLSRTVVLQSPVGTDTYVDNS